MQILDESDPTRDFLLTLDRPEPTGAWYLLVPLSGQPIIAHDD